MNLKLTCVLLMGILLVACQPQATTNTNSPVTTTADNTKSPNTDQTKKAAPTDLNELAKRLVTQSAGVKEGEIVLISGGVRDMELLENIATEVRKVGGEPLLSINSDRMAKASYTEVSEKYDSQNPKLGMSLAKIVNVIIDIESGETDGLLADIPPARIAARGEAGVPVSAEYNKNKVRSVYVGNSLYPTEWRAKQYEMPLDNFAKLFWEGVNIDYTNLQAIGEKARTILTGKELEITHPNGTNLKLNLENKPVYISDGIISADDVQKGLVNVWLPAGEATVIPAANSGDGKFIIEKDFFNGKEIRNLTLTFEKGKLISMTGEGEGFATYKANYEAGGAGKDILSYVDFGMNPNYVLSPSSKYGNWVSTGMVSAGTGGNTWAGGTNNSSVGAGGHLAGATVKIDGKTIVENGKLMF